MSPLDWLVGKTVEVFVDYWLTWESPVHCGQYCHWKCSPGVYKIEKMGKPFSSILPVVSASLPASRFLPWFLHWQPFKMNPVRQINPFLPKLLVIMVCIIAIKTKLGQLRITRLKANEQLALLDVFICVNVCLHKCVCKWMHICVYVYMCVYMCIYLCMYTYVYVCV